MADLSFSKTGKHGQAKAHIVAYDIFTGKKCEELCLSSLNMGIPFVKKTEFQILRADADTGENHLVDRKWRDKGRPVPACSSEDQRTHGGRQETHQADR